MARKVLAVLLSSSLALGPSAYANNIAGRTGPTPVETVATPVGDASANFNFSFDVGADPRGAPETQAFQTTLPGNIPVLEQGIVSHGAAPDAFVAPQLAVGQQVAPSPLLPAIDVHAGSHQGAAPLNGILHVAPGQQPPATVSPGVGSEQAPQLGDSRMATYSKETQGKLADVHGLAFTIQAGQKGDPEMRSMAERMFVQADAATPESAGTKVGPAHWVTNAELGLSPADADRLGIPRQVRDVGSVHGQEAPPGSGISIVAAPLEAAGQIFQVVVDAASELVRKAGWMLAKPAPSDYVDEETVWDTVHRVLNEEVEGAAADAHNVGWKKAKDEDLAKADNPFIGWGPKRVRVTEEIKGKSKEELERLLGVKVTDQKFAAIRGARIGQDITHHLYKPYPEMLRDQADGGTRMAGQNALPLLVLTLYLTDFRKSETGTRAGLERVLRGLVDGTDKEGIAKVSRIMHVAFQGLQLGFGERGYENTVLDPRTGQAVKVAARTDFRPFDELHRDVQALDAYTLLPAAKWLLERSARLPRQEPLHAFSEFMALGPADLDRLSVLPTRQQMVRLRARSSQFKRELQLVTGRIETLKKELPKAQAREAASKELWDLVYRLDVEDMTAEELTAIFYAFKQEDLFQDMVELYDRSVNRAFKRATIIRELLSVALHKTGDLERSERVAQRLKSANESAEIYTILGKIYKLRYLTRNETGALAQSVGYLEPGFLKDFGYYPGINLVYNRITQGVDSHSSDAVGRARRLAEMVYVAAQKAGGLYSDDYWTLATMLEASVILGWDKEASQALSQLAKLKKAPADWEIQSTAENLERLGDQLGMKDKMAPVLAALRGRQAGPAARLTAAQQKAQRLFEIGFTFGEIQSNSMGGSVPRGGQLHDRVVNPWDFAVARAILDYKGLRGKDVDFDAFNAGVDQLIRERFGTDGLEAMHTRQHREFDEFSQRLLDMMGIGKDADSRTNLMLDFWLAQGDCRPHAEIKQLFFNIWKSDRINSLMRRAYDHLQKDEIAQYEAVMSQVKALERLHMLTFDSYVKAPIVVPEKYKPVLTADRHDPKALYPVYSGDGAKVSVVEDHTWNGLVILDDDGGLAEFRQVDSFYQHVYEFGGSSVENGVARAGIGVPLDSIGLDGEIVAGRRIRVHDPWTGSVIEVPVTLSPTSYSGGQGKRVKPNADEYGQVRLRGIAIDGLPGTERNQPDVSSFFDPELRRAIERFAERVRRESEAAVVAALRQAVEGLEVTDQYAPPIQYWEKAIRSIMEDAGIAVTPDNLNAVVALLEVRHFGSDESQFRVQLKPGLNRDASDPYFLAALRVIAQSRTVIDRYAPRLEQWADADRWIDEALRATFPGQASFGARDVERVRAFLTVSGSDRGHHFIVRVRPDRP